MWYSLSISLGVASSLKIVSGRLRVGLTSGLTSEVGLTSGRTSGVGLTSGRTSGLAPMLVKEEVAQV